MTDPSAEYLRRLDASVEIAARKEQMHLNIGYFKLAVIVAGLLLAWLSLKNDLFSPYWLALPVATYASLVILHERIIRARTAAELRAEFYRKGVMRLEGRWAGTGDAGERYRDPKHVYADDLDLFGRGGVFELLSTARTPMGADWLARWLRAASPIPAIRERHELITELRERLDLREEVAIAGEQLRARLNPEKLVAWAESQPLLPARALRAIAAALALCAVAMFMLLLAARIGWPLLIVLAFELFLLRLYHHRALLVITGANCNAEGMNLFSKILERFEREPFVSVRLCEIAAKLKREPGPASRFIRKLERIVYWIDARESHIARLLRVPLLYDLQVALAAEAWRRQWGARMRACVDAVGEMEALLSFAAYSFEHPNDPFPNFAEANQSQPVFDGAELGHPLIPAAQCVRNSVRLDATTRVLLVSGSNMSGKSTFLRTVGINAVLAMAGAPIRGKSLRLTPVVLGTSIRTTDSLQENRSSFYTEILRIRQVFELTNGNASLLFLFDELLEGTNSKDRRIGAEGLLRVLVSHGAVGAVTTHDLALTAIAQSLDNAVRNMHFQDYVESGKMRFDYKLRDGVVSRSNALELMRLIGLNV
ncbi:MAG: mismatch repair protein [Acidobacteria bacterium]|nr:MAG: mismatch repair protein [Acidobacteriota bacterium]